MTEIKQIIEVKNLTKSFNHQIVVDDINLSVKKGEIFGFLGPNGSGKTTTIRILCGLIKPDAGSGYCLDYNILTQSDLIKKKVGYMTQHFSLYKDLSIRENLELIARLYCLDNIHQRVNQALNQLAISHQRSRQLAGTLSGGWKQRLSLAAAILHEPELLLLDEPTAGVDPKARRDFWAEIHQLSHQGVTILVSTHYMDEAERCHRLAYINMGTLLVQGTQQDIINHANLDTYLIKLNNNYNNKNLSLAELSEALLKNAEIKQVNAFGQYLHLSVLKNNIININNINIKIEKIDTSLEDVFIYLMGQQSEV